MGGWYRVAILYRNNALEAVKVECSGIMLLGRRVSLC